MEEIPNNGTSINKLSPLDQDLTTNLGTLRAQEEPTTCKSGAPTQDGGKSSPMKDNTSSTSRTRKLLIFMETKMKKEERSKYGRDIMAPTRDGESSILTQRVLRKRPLDGTLNGVSISIDFSTLDQDSQ
jgi:hypothetical protein